MPPNRPSCTASYSGRTTIYCRQAGYVLVIEPDHDIIDEVLARRADTPGFDAHAYLTRLAAAGDPRVTIQALPGIPVA